MNNSYALQLAAYATIGGIMGLLDFPAWAILAAIGACIVLTNLGLLPV